eukprot:m.127848 g.127848  ORF g.127848 m.127848 type:complete len:377 (-) comp29300_c0_seq2:134-1264(-)
MLFQLVSVLLLLAGNVHSAKLQELKDGDLDAITAPHFVKFFAPWCGHCKRMAEAWTELASENTGAIVIAEVDCTRETGLCSEHGITGYPTIKFYTKEGATDYTGGRTIGALKHFISGELVKLNSNSVVSDNAETIDGLTTLTDASFSSATKKGFAFVKFFAPWCGHCKRMQPAWVELASDYESNPSVVIGEMDCTLHKDVCKNENVKGYPTLLTFNDGKRAAKYAGAREVAAFRSFVEMQLETLEVDSKVEKPVDTEVEDLVVVNGLAILTDATFSNAVKNDWSIVKFYAPWCGHCKKLEPVWKGLATAFEAEEKITVAKMDCTVHSDTCTEYEVRGYPTLTVFKGGKKMANYDGKRDLESLTSYLMTQLERHDEL